MCPTTWRLSLWLLSKGLHLMLLCFGENYPEVLINFANIARVLDPGSAALGADAAYAMLVDEGLAPPRIPPDDRVDTLAANIVDGRVGGIPVGQLNTEAARDRAYAALVEQGVAQPAPTEAEIAALREEGIV